MSKKLIDQMILIPKTEEPSQRNQINLLQSVLNELAEIKNRIKYLEEQTGYSIEDTYF